MDIQEIFEFLPHRYPFLFIDGVTELIEGSAIKGFKNVTINEPFFEGHFPNQPIMPGVLIVEAMAQLAGILGFKSKGTKPSEGYLYFLAGTDNTRFKRPVGPGDRLDLSAEIINERRQIMKFACTGHVANELSCSSDIIIAERKI
mgnify:FL=1